LGTSNNNRHARYYELTRRGRGRLEIEITAWRRLSDAVAQVLEMEPKLGVEFLWRRV
jgi:PadR family transcriptional regulator, regulatory protein PadR